MEQATVLSFGYMEELLLIPVVEAATGADGLAINLADTTDYVGHETIVVRDEATINPISEVIFAYLNRNAVHEEKRNGIPLDQVVEIGTQTVI